MGARVRVEECPCCGLAHDGLELFAAAGASAGAKLKLWYVCPEFGLRVPVDFREVTPPPAREN